MSWPAGWSDVNGVVDPTDTRAISTFAARVGGGAAWGPAAASAEALVDRVPRAEADAVEARPRLRAGEAVALFAGAWARLGPARGAKPLPSYDDQNWLVELAAGRRVVLKIAAAGAACRGGAGAAATAAALDCEGSMMTAVARGGVAAPLALPADGGAPLVAFRWRGLACFARVITFLEGTPLSDLRAAADGSLLDALGSAVARIDVALARLPPRPDGGDAETRVLFWDLGNASRLSRPYLCDLRDVKLGRMVARALDDFDALVSSAAFAALPRQLIHGDVNDENVMCRKRGDAWEVGVLDFGDFARTYRVFDLAIALAYALFDGGGDLDVSTAGGVLRDVYPQAADVVLRRATRLLELDVVVDSAVLAVTVAVLSPGAGERFEDVARIEFDGAARPEDDDVRRRLSFADRNIVCATLRLSINRARADFSIVRSIRLVGVPA